MTVGVEDVIANQWIGSVLKGDTGAGGVATLSTAGIWDNADDLLADAGVHTHYAMLSGIEVRGVGTTTIMMDMLWIVKAVAEQSSDALTVPVASRIYSLLHGSIEVATADGRIVSCVREQPFRLNTVQGGRQYRQRGGIYRIFAQGT